MADKGMTFRVRKGGRKIRGQAASDLEGPTAWRAEDKKPSVDENERGKNEEPKKPVRDRALDKK